MRRKPAISLVGGGRAGRALGRALRAKGWKIGYVATRSRATAHAAVRVIGGGQPLASLQPEILEADLILLVTPDDSLAAVAGKLARLGGRSWRGKVVLHTSGALDHRVLAPLRRLGAATGSAHPMQTFGGRRIPKLDGVLFGIEGSSAAVRMARRLALDLDGIPIVVREGRKFAYHAAAVMVAGLGMGLLEAATRMLMSAGFTRQRAMQSLLLLQRQVLLDAERLGTVQAWTGPLARGDFGVIAAHQQALRRLPKEFGEAYAALAKLAVRTLAAYPEPVMRKLKVALSGTQGGKH